MTKHWLLACVAFTTAMGSSLAFAPSDLALRPHLHAWRPQGVCHRFAPDTLGLRMAAPASGKGFGKAKPAPKKAAKSAETSAVVEVSAPNGTYAAPVVATGSALYGMPLREVQSSSGAAASATPATPRSTAASATSGAPLSSLSQTGRYG